MVSVCLSSDALLQHLPSYLGFSYLEVGYPFMAAITSYPTLEARGSGREKQPHVQGVVAARAQEGLEELSHIEGQEGGQ